MNETFIYSVIGIVATIAVILGYVLAALNARIKLDQMKDKYVALNTKLDKEKKQTSRKFSSVERMRHDIEETISSIAHEDIPADIPHDKDKFARFMLHPLHEALRSADIQLASLTKEEERTRTLLNRQLELLRTPLKLGRGSIKEIAASLGDAEARKHWCQDTIRELIEITYMDEHYKTPTPKTKEGEKPAATHAFEIKLPDDSSIAIDATTPLEAYINICQAPDDSVRSWHKETHARKLREQIMSMASRAYGAQFEKQPEVIILLILNDHYLSVALEVEPDLIKVAQHQNIVLATPADLLTLLQAISFNWKHIRFSHDAKKMRHTGVHLYKNFGTFINLIAELGTELTDVLNSYNRAVSCFEEAQAEKATIDKSGDHATDAAHAKTQGEKNHNVSAAAEK